MEAKRHVLRRLIVRAVLGAAVAGPVALGALWLALHHKPDWYDPQTLDEVGIRRARSDAVAVADYVSDRMVEGKPFQVVLNERSVREWVAALPATWPEVRGALPANLRDPAVHFDEGCIRVGAHYKARHWQAIVSMRLTVSVSDDGSAVLAALTGVRGGSLPIPRAVVEHVLAPLLENARKTREGTGHTSDLLSSVAEALSDRQDLFEGVRIRNRFVWFNGRRPFRISSIGIEPGELRLWINPD